MTGHRFELKPVAKEEDNVFSLLLPVHNLLLQTSVFEATELEARAFAAKANATTQPNAQDGAGFVSFRLVVCVCEREREWRRRATCFGVCRSPGAQD